MAYKKSTYTSQTKRETLPELKSKGVYNLADDPTVEGSSSTYHWTKNDANDKYHIYKREQFNVFDDQTIMDTIDDDPGSGWALRKLNDKYGQKKVLLNGVEDLPEGLAGDYVGKADYAAYVAQQASSNDFRLGRYTNEMANYAESGLTCGLFANGYGNAETYKFEWVYGDDGTTRTGMKLSAKLDANDYQDQTVTATSNSAGDELTLSNISFFDKIKPDGDSIQRTQAIRIFLDTTLDLKLYISGVEKNAAIYGGDYYTIDSVNETITISAANHTWTANKSVNVKISMGIDYGFNLRIRGMETGKTYSISGEWAINKIGSYANTYAPVEGQSPSTGRVKDAQGGTPHVYWDNRDHKYRQRTFVAAHADISDASTGDFGEAFTKLRNVQDDDIGKFHPFDCTGGFNLYDEDGYNPGPDHNFIDIGIQEEDNRAQGEIEVEIRNLKIVENDDKCLTVRRTSDNCHAHVHFGGRGEIDLLSPITQAAHSVTSGTHSRTANVSESTGEGSTAASRSETYGLSLTKARTLGEFVKEINNPQKEPMYQSNKGTPTEWEVIDDGKGFEMVASANDDRIIIPLTERIDNQSMIKTKVTIECDIELDTGSLSVKPHNNTRDGGAWTGFDATGATLSNNVVNASQNRQHFSYTFQNADGKSSNYDVAGIGFSNFTAGAKVKVTNIKITVKPSIVVTCLFDQNTLGGTDRSNEGYEKVRHVHNAIMPEYQRQPTLVNEEGEIHKIHGKSSILFKYAREHLEIQGIIKESNNFSIYSVVKKYDPSVTALADVTGQTTNNNEFFVSQGLSGTNGVHAAMMGIGYNASRPVVRINDTNMSGGAIGSAHLNALHEGAIYSANTGNGHGTNCLTYMNGELISESAIPTDGSGDYLIVDPGNNHIGGHGEGNGLKHAQISELILLKKGTEYLRPYIEADMQSFYRGNGVIPFDYAVITNDDDTLTGSQFYHLRTRCNTDAYEKAKAGIVTFKYFIPKGNNNIVGAYFHIGVDSYKNGVGGDVFNYTGQPSEPLVAGEWRTTSVKFGKLFGGADKVDQKRFLFLSKLADPSQTGQSGRVRLTRGEDIIIADLSVREIQEHTVSSSTTGTYDAPKFVDTETYVEHS